MLLTGSILMQLTFSDNKSDFYDFMLAIWFIEGKILLV